MKSYMRLNVKTRTFRIFDANANSGQCWNHFTSDLSKL